MAPAVDMHWRNVCASGVSCKKCVGAHSRQIRGFHSGGSQGMLGHSTRAWRLFFVSRTIGTGGLYLSGLYFAVYGAYCLANFARCREAHCIITGLGWAVLAIVALVAAATQHNWLTQIWNAFRHRVHSRARFRTHLGGNSPHPRSLRAAPELRPRSQPTSGPGLEKCSRIARA